MTGNPEVSRLGIGLRPARRPKFRMVDYTPITSIHPNWLLLFCHFWDGSAESAEIVAEAVGVAFAKEGFDRGVSAQPDGNGSCQQPSALWGQRHEATAAVGWVDGYLEQAAAHERLESGCERGAVHCQQRGH